MSIDTPTKDIAMERLAIRVTPGIGMLKFLNFVSWDVTVTGFFKTVSNSSHPRHDRRARPARPTDKHAGSLTVIPDDDDDVFSCRTSLTLSRTTHLHPLSTCFSLMIQNGPGPHCFTTSVITIVCVSSAIKPKTTLVEYAIF